MKRLRIDLENCFGIKDLHVDLSYSTCNTNVIYAPNGAMKSSLASTFQDIADGREARDRFFPARESKRSITDETGASIDANSILVVRPYDETYGHSTKTSILLVNATLREEYERLHVEINAAKSLFLRTMKELSGSKRDLEAEVSSSFTTSSEQFYRALTRVRDEVVDQDDAPFSGVKYDLLFDEAGLAVIGTQDFQAAIGTYIKKYNELIDASTYFKRGTFNYYNAGQIAKSLASNGFFKAAHSITLKGGEKVEIESEKQLEEIIQKEKDAITSDADLKKRFNKLASLLEKNAAVRGFEAYLAEHEELLPHLSNIPQLREDVWKSYFKSAQDQYLDLLDKYQATEKRRGEILAEAQSERTQWQEVIDIFNDRFVVPFKLAPKNLVAVALAQEPMLALDFIFQDGDDEVSVERKALMEALSTGERKAFYLLNILFEIEVRRKSNVETLIVIDDVADSFDYKNKYAIIQYLADIAGDALFKQLILTHNFDFFRTVQGRFVKYDCCYMATKDDSGIKIRPAQGIKNVFVNDWKVAFFTDAKKRIASIPFIRNLIEFTRGDDDPEFLRLTSLLHLKPESDAITEANLDAIYNGFFGGSLAYGLPGKAVVASISEAAGECLDAPDGANFENKIVLSIAVRLAAERYLIGKISDKAAIAAIKSNQTPKLLKLFKAEHPTLKAEIKVMERVTLMTPENIHLNSFMYEPILDMSDQHLRKLYQDVLALN